MSRNPARPKKKGNERAEHVWDTSANPSPRGQGGEQGQARQSGGSQSGGQGASHRAPSKRGSAGGKPGGKGDD
jgi:hypothetical protein